MLEKKDQFWFLIVLLILSWLVFQPGTIDSDDRVSFYFTSRFFAAHFNWSQFVGLAGAGAAWGDLSHQFSWFAIQSIVFFPYWLLSHYFPALSSDVLTQLYLSSSLHIAIWAAIFIAWKVLRREGLSPAVSALTLFGIFAGSYSISLLSGPKLLVCWESLLVCGELFLMQKFDETSQFRRILAGLVGGYLVSLRPYALAPVVVLAALAFVRPFGGRTRAIGFWCAGFAAAVIVLVGLPQYLEIPKLNWSQMAGPSPQSPFFVSTYFSRAAGAFFSFGYGLPLTAPIYLCALFSRNPVALCLKGLAILAILLFTFLFPGWAGESGIAGDRYVAAYLLLLLPETGWGIRYLLTRDRRLVLAIPILAFAFLPCLFFRHNVTTDYAAGEFNQKTDVHPIIGKRLPGQSGAVNPAMPLWSPLFHPAIFGWWQAISLADGSPMVLPLGVDISIDPRLIPPYGLASRLIYLDYVPLDNVIDPRVAVRQRFYFQLPFWIRQLPLVGLGAVLMAWLALLVMYTRRILNSPATQGI